MTIRAIAKRGLTALAQLMVVPSLAHAAQVATVPPQTRTFTMPPQAHFDELLHEVFWDITILGGLLALVAAYFLIAYRRKSPDDVGKPPVLSPQAALGWLIIPVALFLADDIFLFAKGWELHKQYRDVPAGAYEIKVTGSMWSWTYTYPNKVETYGELRVPVGTPILLRMSSEDVVHSHFMQRYRVTEDLMPGRITYMWFMPEKIGESVVTCREYCGAGHSSMYGKVIVMAKNDFDAWLSAEGGGNASAADAPTVTAAAPAVAGAVQPKL